MYELEVFFGGNDEYVAKISYWARWTSAAGGQLGTMSSGWKVDEVTESDAYPDIKADEPETLTAKEYYAAHQASLDALFDNQANEAIYEISPFTD